LKDLKLFYYNKPNKLKELNKWQTVWNTFKEWSSNF